MELPKQTVNTILKEFEKKKSWYSSVSLLTTTENAASVSPMPALHTHKTSFQSLMELETQAMEKMGKDRADALIENTALFIDYFKEGMNHE